jgi:NAD-dependent deacetylase
MEIKKLMKSTIDAVIDLMKGSSSMVVLTGAGISTDSGIPDFRSPQGLWNTVPSAMGPLSYFRDHPEGLIELGMALLPILQSAVPNRGHIALKELEEMGYLKGIITQNIDGLHQLAGSKTVIEIHGTYKTATCLDCGKPFTIDEVLSLLIDSPFPSLTCPACSGLVKPDVVMFGEHLPQHAFSQAKTLAQRADVMMVAGSSLEVYPASHLVLMIKNHGGRVIILNDTTTALDRIADVIMREQLSVSLPQLVERVKKEEENP